MPLNANQTTMKIYGTGSQNTVPTSGTLEGRELFINTFNAYHVGSVAIANAGINFTADDVGFVGTGTFTGGTQLAAPTFVIDSVDAATGEITGLSILFYGAWSSPPTSLTGTVSFPNAAGSGFTATITLLDNPTIANGGGLYVGDAVDPNEVVKVTGSIAAQDHNNVNIVGGSISNVTLNGVDITANAGNTTRLVGAELVNPAIDGGTQTNVDIESGNIGSAGTYFPTAYITDLFVPNTDLPNGVTSLGSLILGSDGQVYVTDTLRTGNLIVDGNLAVTGGVRVGDDTFNNITGSIVATNDVTAFGS